MDSSDEHGELITLEDLPIDWLQEQCGINGEEDDHEEYNMELGLQSLCHDEPAAADGYVPHFTSYDDHVYAGQSTSLISCSSRTPGTLAAAEDMMGELQLVMDDEFLINDLSSPSLDISGDVEAAPEFGSDTTNQLLANFSFDSLNTTITCLSDKETQSPLPPIKVVRSTSPKKRVRPHSSKSKSSNKKKKISSPTSVLDFNMEQAHCVHGSSSNFSTCLSQHKQQDLLEPLPKTSSPQKHSKKSSNSHSSTHLSKESKWAQQLLKACASAISTNNISRTQHLMWVLNDLASFTGDANQRLAACGLKALFSRVSGIVSSPPSLQHTPESDSNAIALSHHRALLKFQDASPWHKCSYTIANGAIVEACEGHDTIHVVDIGISQGTQWPTLIEALATRASGAPKLLKLTMVQKSVGGANFVSRLETFAKRLGLNLKLRSIATPMESLTHRDHLGLEEGEELIVCLQFRLHLLTQEANYQSENHVSSSNDNRDSFLKFIHTLNPNTLILSDNDVDHCSPDFLNRFQKAMEFHWSFLDSTNASFQGQDSEERQIMEDEAAFAFTNIVAFEGSSRVERNEAHRAWSCRAQRVGFSSYLPGAQVLESAKSLLRKHSGDWNMLVEDGTMVLRWKGSPTTFCSVWRPISNNHVHHVVASAGSSP